ncbi:MAG TPA: ATP-binding protein [Vicinamibacterales bacterium]|nr:ATP-binding protein [Vicinamibacterales bacterium]
MSCLLCDDTGWKSIEDRGVRRVTRCDCWRERLVDTFLQDAKIPPRYRRCDLESFRTENDSLVYGLEKARAFVETFPIVEKGLFFLGHPGVGKTHLAVAVLRLAIRTRGARGIFYDTRELLRVIRSTYNPLVRAAEMDVLRPVMEADLLVLDDLGAEKTSEWVEETLNLIVNTRYNERRPTVFTSNYDAKDDATDPDSLEVRVGFRIWSRLHEMCEFVTLKGVDFRMAGPDATPEELARLDQKRPRSGMSRLPPRAKGQARAQLRDPADQRSELRWPGGKAGR